MNIAKELIQIAKKIASEKSLDDVYVSLKTALKNKASYSRYADFKKEELNSNSILLRVRDWGIWKSRNDRRSEEDDDYKEPTQETKNTIDQLIKNFKKTFPDFNIDWDYSEKNWIEIVISK